MQQVASAAGLHRATVHRHFASREDLVETLRRRAGDESLAALRKARLEEDPAPEALARGTRSLVAQGERWSLGAYAVPATASAASDEMGHLVRDVLARGQQEGVVRDDLDADLLSVMWGGMLAVNGALRERGLSNDETADVIVRTLLGPAGAG